MKKEASPEQCRCTPFRHDSRFVFHKRIDASDLQVYKQKVKHMLYDHQNDINALKIQIEAATKDAAENCKAEHEALREDKAVLKQQLCQQVHHEGLPFRKSQCIQGMCKSIGTSTHLRPQERQSILSSFIAS